ncbi:response regulator [Agromyces archimandritae]|uniref:Response regulator n=1 Tax=Agromyces archimandritae TaxID=2781962 RepID=A0A975IQ25_9MICO|nr:response regulator transcription factor [Agromyces archimandritae]QTX06200.1 response regulator [Agromyces archimandritae]
MVTVRVLVVDDQDLVRAGFRTILDSDPGIEVVGEAADGAAAIDAARRLDPDVICMDVQMPGVDGLEATRAITADPAIGAAVLMLTTFNREDYLFEALAAGASGFLLKNSSPENLLEAVRVVGRGDALLAPDVTRHVIEAVVGRAGADAGAAPAAAPASTGPGAPAAPVTAPSPSAARTPSAAAESVAPGPIRPPAASAPGLDALTDREREVLELLAKGLSNAEIAARLYVGEATVKSHVSKVLMKLGLRDRVHAVVYAYEHGIARPAD